MVSVPVPSTSVFQSSSEISLFCPDVYFSFDFSNTSLGIKEVTRKQEDPILKEKEHLILHADETGFEKLRKRTKVLTAIATFGSVAGRIEIRARKDDKSLRPF